MPMTITEALAEIKTVGKRIAKKREYIQQYLARAEGMKDPLERDGGAEAVIGRERQSIADLETRIVNLRMAIQRANEATAVTINGVTRTIAEWLVWRREVAPSRQQWLIGIRRSIASLREGAQKKGANIFTVSAVAQAGDTKPIDLIINVDEADLAAQIEELEDTLGQLDGQLSLKNATVMVDA